MFSIFGGSTVGLDLGQHALRAAVVKSRGGKPEVLSMAEVGLPAGLVSNSFTEPNIQDTAAFTEAAARLADIAGARGGAVNVTLPDFVSRVSILEFDSVQPKDDDTAQMIKWRMKKLLPFDVEQAVMRWQYLGKFVTNEKEQHRFLVSIIKSDIMSQYESALKAAGLKPRRIELSSFAVWNLFEPQVSSEAGADGAFALMNLTGGKMTVIVFDHGVPHFLRIKDMGGIDDTEQAWVTRMVRELNASVTFYRENYGRNAVETVYLTGDMAGLREVSEEITRSAGLKSGLLDPSRVLTLNRRVTVGPGSLSAYSAACGAAWEA